MLQVSYKIEVQSVCVGGGGRGRDRLPTLLELSTFSRVMDILSNLVSPKVSFKIVCRLSLVTASLLQVEGGMKRASPKIRQDTQGDSGGSQIMM